MEFVNRLFRSEWYKRDEKIGSSRIVRDWSARYWFPLISLCQGFRPSEISGLMLDDVYYDDGLLAFRIKEGKTEATNRSVSVHQKLIDLGFDQWLAGRKKRGGKLLLDVFESYERNNDAFTQKFNRYIRDKLDATAGYTTYSFRHLWEDTRRAAIAQHQNAAWPPGMRAQISGREDGQKEEGSAGDYGNGYSVKSMKPYLDSVWNSQILLPKPYEA